MWSDNKEESSKELFSIFIESETVDQALLFEAINKELEAFLAKGFNEKDGADGIPDFLATISDTVQEEFDELVSGDSDTKALSERLDRHYQNKRL